MSFEGWSIVDKRIVPSHDMCLRATQWSSENVSLDVPFTFEFDASHSAQPVLINEIFLKKAGEPFEALTKQYFKEGNQRKVCLCPEDSPVVFGVIKQFLYYAQIDLSQLNLKEMVQIAVSSHRWELRTLYHIIQEFIVEHQLICNYEDVVRAKRIIDLRDSRCTFRMYFYLRCAYNIGTRRQIANNSTGPGLSEIAAEGAELFDVVQALEDEVSGGLEDIWEMAVSDGRAGNLIVHALEVAPRHRRRNISALVMLKLELLIDCDDELTRVLRFLLMFNDGLEDLFNIPVVKKFASARAVRLCSIGMTRMCNLENFSSGMRFSLRYTILLSKSNQKEINVRPYGECSDFHLNLSWTVTQTDVEVNVRLSRQERCFCQARRRRSRQGGYIRDERPCENANRFPVRVKVSLRTAECACARNVVPLCSVFLQTMQETEQDRTSRRVNQNNSKEIERRWKGHNPHQFSVASNSADECIEDDCNNKNTCGATLHITAEEIVA